MTIHLKTTHKPVEDYYSELEKYNILGFDNEGAVKNSFANLIRSVSKKLGYTLVEEYKIERKDKTIFVDGALIDDFKISHGFWEAKDSKDDLDNEVTIKFASGYPQSNIIFQAPQQAIIIQNGAEVFNKDLDNPEHIIEALEIFFSYRPPFHEEWRKAVDEFKDKVPNIALGILELIEKERLSNKGFIEAFDNFSTLCRRAINPNLSLEAIEEMLIQHILTVRIFSNIFDNPDFANKNIIAHEIEKVIAALISHYFKKSEFLKPLDPFYVAIENTASTITDYTEKQSFLNTVYEKFFQGFSVKVADTHGIVYTPQPIVNFMVNSIEDILQNEFGRSLSDEGVHILDPFVGTGNFITCVMRKIRKIALPYKYAHELHCNEVLLLPYYIASMNIEHEYYQRINDYQPFPGICLVDTFELAEPEQLSFLSEENTERVERQKESPIFVILGNPPYNARQVKENDKNKNRKYPVIDERVKNTYAKDSKASNVNQLGDPYVKAIRWASDRIGNEGIVAFITNNSFIDAIAFDGMRKHLEKDFNHLYIFDLKGNVRKDSMKDGIPIGEKHTIFGLASMVGISITFFIKNKKLKDHKIFYSEVDFRATRNEKFSLIESVKIARNLEWREIKNDKNNTWLTEGIKKEFNDFLPIGTKEAKNSKEIDTETIFKMFSMGISTNRDNVVYDFNREKLKTRVKQFANDYNTEVYRYIKQGKNENIDNFVDYSKVKWSSALKSHLKSGKIVTFNERKIVQSAYRPFIKMLLYYDGILIHRPAHFHKIFSKLETESENKTICLSGIGSSKPFHCIVSNIISDLHLTGDSQCFPFYIYDKEGSNRRENITDWAMEQFQSHYNDTAVTKWDIFYYSYGILHHPRYREKYAANLRRELPRIPFAGDFRAFSKAGERLADFHINYEQKDEYPLREIENPDLPLDWRVEKMRLSKDKRSIVYNDFLTLADIPEEVFSYRLGNRSALEWIIDQYRVKTDARSGIVSDPNNENKPDYIVRLIKKIITVSLETVNIVKELPEILEIV